MIVIKSSGSLCALATATKSLKQEAYFSGSLLGSFISLFTRLKLLFFGVSGNQNGNHFAFQAYFGLLAGTFVSERGFSSY